MSAMPETRSPLAALERKPVRLLVNGEAVEHLVEPRTHLGDFVREQCGLTGTHLGCEHGVCGACTVLLDGKPVRSCITFAVACESRKVTTIEGYGDDPVMALLRKAFNQEHALQCGYCTPGMLATARDIVTRLPDADEQRIRLELSGNLCRCTGYVGIVRAIQSVLVQARAQGGLQLAAAAPVVSQHAAPMQTFATRAADATPAAAIPAAPAPAAPEAAAGESRRGWSQMQGSFEVDFPPERVWEFMGDVRALAACLPGAEVQEADGSSVKGRIAVKFGPISAAFNGAASLERNAATHSGMLRGAGTDTVSQSRAKGDIGYQLVALDGGQRTRVDITLEHMLQGPLAQFSRSGLVRDFVSRMITQFGLNLNASMGGARADQLPVQKIGLFRMLWQVVVARLRG
ncbi:2Fe-2S iron-sulfur cluster-binding protein [Lacisediminimonas sp.]|uniref:xanthine dehydrogenase family Fe-S subunit n=1 Tax=Lacisediminimonas sp. TaxID=3060582 RepID=UPI00271D12D3|nr:2Fe-2S iron-sulfur cluster-binding protein [Lacisediminimonas sp.]MDO8299624.1 2Fe-2S iron-sulfur cluster-binding protein [Lacisediminimonas sp.]